MAANKVPGIRAALCYDKASARNSREHNDSNVLTLGARLLTRTQAEEVLRTWIATPFAGGRHQARVQKIMDIEQRYLQERIVVTQAELDRLVAQIGEEILARVPAGPRAVPTKAAEGLNLPDQVCPGCVQRCAQTCARNTQEIIAAGAARVSASERLTKIDPAIAALIDHTILKPDATRADVIKVCREARQYSFASVCVNPYWVPLVRAELAGSPVKVCTVVGFPLGATSTGVEGGRNRHRRARRRAGNRHGDQCGRAAIGRSRCREGRYPGGGRRLRTQAGAIVKVILETALLDDTQKAIACMLAKAAGADFVKTSTGFGPSGATAHDVALMRQAVGPEMGVKAAGGIRTLAGSRSHDRGGRHAHRRQRQREDRRGHRCLMRVATTVPRPCRPPQSLGPFPRTLRAARFPAGGFGRHRQTLDLDQLLANVAEIIQKVLPYDLFAILLYNEKRQDLRIRYAVGHREEIVRDSRTRARAKASPEPPRRAASRCWWAMSATIRATCIPWTRCAPNWPSP